jgi:hypothetical protein
MPTGVREITARMHLAQAIPPSPRDVRDVTRAFPWASLREAIAWPRRIGTPNCVWCPRFPPVSPGLPVSQHVRALDAHSIDAVVLQFDCHHGVISRLRFASPL